MIHAIKILQNCHENEFLPPCHDFEEMSWHPWVDSKPYQFGNGLILILSSKYTNFINFSHHTVQQCSSINIFYKRRKYSTNTNKIFFSIIFSEKLLYEVEIFRYFCSMACVYMCVLSYGRCNN